jgi:hypothetical protein
LWGIRYGRKTQSLKGLCYQFGRMGDLQGHYPVFAVFECIILPLREN